MFRILYARYTIYLICAFAALTGLLFGYDSSIIAGALLFIPQEFTVSHFFMGLIVSAVPLGVIAGALVSGKFTDVCGRRWMLAGVAFLFMGGTLLTIFAWHAVLLVVGRLLIGVAMGVGLFAAPLYIAEMAPPNRRGFLVTLNQLGITFGILIAYCVGFIFSESGHWRMMLGIGLIPAALLWLGIFLIPESPRWMLTQGLSYQARQVLQSIRNQRNVTAELEAIEQSIAHTPSQRFKLLLAPWVRPVIFLAFGLAVFQQVTGINVIVYYAPLLLQRSGLLQAGNALLTTMEIGVVNVLFTLVALFLFDRVGRRPLLLLGSFGMLIGLILIGLSFPASAAPARLWLMIMGMLFYIASFAISWGPAFWLLLAEIFPLGMRGVGMGFFTAVNSACSTLLVLSFLPLANLISAAHLFWFYALLCGLSFLFVYFKVPETKGIALECIESNLRAGKTSRELGLSSSPKSF